MPGSILQADSGFPNLVNYATTDDKLNAVQNYLFLLLEQLRYALRNIGPENLNSAEMTDWIGKNIKAETIISSTVITNELYSDYGAIADLVVDELRTDYRKAQNYLAGITANVDYLHIHDEEIEFITDTYAGGTEQLHHGDRYFWWKDADMTQMTSEEETAYPVIVYTYTTSVKGTYRFDTVDGVKIPELVFGAGYGQADAERGKGFIRKNTDSFDLWLLTSAGKKLGMFVGDSYTDIAGLRKPTELDFSAWDNGLVTETLDGNVHNSFTITFDANDRPIKFTDASGHETAVVWE